MNIYAYRYFMTTVLSLLCSNIIWDKRGANSKSGVSHFQFVYNIFFI